MNERRDGQTYYEILEIPTTAGPGDIYAAYQRARSTYSPSSPALYSMFTAEEAHELLGLIDEAYQTLSHQARRRDYDVKIGLAAAPAPRVAQTVPPPMVQNSVSRSSGGEGWVGPVKVNPRREDLAPGQARTKYSVYEINPEMEEYIRGTVDCDGEFLKKVRLYKGVSLDQMSEEIRVIKSTLATLEANDVNALPVAVFTRGFVVQFARTLGLDDRRVSDSYMKFFRAKRTK